jgi:Ni/Fe-hydrogenase subunit HybB-like protein
MLPQNAISAAAAVFIVAMVWLRSRMHYGARGRRSLTPAGVVYFAALLALLVAGWFAAPVLGRHLAAAFPIASAFARVVWFLAIYYLFIPVHLALKARGVAVFRAGDSSQGGMV